MIHAPIYAPAHSYDDVPYPGRAYSQTHPDHMAVLATLLGLTPPPVECCRVLEIGCAAGGNLVPMALGLPQAAFVGIDISPRQIAAGNDLIAALRLTNIRLLVRDILEVDDAFGEFDYIIAHGIYSWVPAAVRDRLMAICKRHLAPNGIAYVSYNTYPGWHVLGALRDLMLHRTAATIDQQERARQAMEVLDLLADSEPDGLNAFGSFFASYAAMFRTMLNRLGPLRDSFLVHDALEVVNEPVYFAHFAAHAVRHGLQYLTETEFPMVLPIGLKPETVDAIRAMSQDGIDLEQYMDFFRGRQFRQTLLCHDHVAVQRTLRPERLAGMAVTALLRPEQQPLDIASDAPVVFRNTYDVPFTVATPISKAALLYLAEESPRAIPFDEVLAVAQQRLADAGAPMADVAPATLARRLGGDLLRAFSTAATLVSFYLHPPHVAQRAGERPMVTALTRLEARAGSEVTNRYHEMIHLDPFDRQLAQFLDGSHDRAALAQAMAGAIATGQVQPAEHEAPVTTVADLALDVDRRVHWFAQVALLVQ
ncbi:MAG: methyltransferase regulatory domain-containing protein [Chloroflexi bacterium]|nr:methyltransferase regulatory domain-containing protein [Chloroflexota bacterium]